MYCKYWTPKYTDIHQSESFIYTIRNAKLPKSSNLFPKETFLIIGKNTCTPIFYSGSLWIRTQSLKADGDWSGFFLLLTRSLAFFFVVRSFTIPMAAKIRVRSQFANTRRRIEKISLRPPTFPLQTTFRSFYERRLNKLAKERKVAARARLKRWSSSAVWRASADLWAARFDC